MLSCMWKTAIAWLLQAIRILDGSDSQQINTLAIDDDGLGIVSGGGDKLVKVRAAAQEMGNPSA